jgi:hypothetical protein
MTRYVAKETCMAPRKGIIMFMCAVTLRLFLRFQLVPFVSFVSSNV